MLPVVQSTQVLVLAFVLLAASLAKLTVPQVVPAAPHGVRGVPAADDVRGVPAADEVYGVAAPGRRTPWLSRQVTLGLGVFEGVLGLAMMMSAHASVRLATTVMFAAATWVVGELRRQGSGTGCGCFGELSREPVGRRGVVRTGLCTLAAVVALGAPHSGTDVLRQGPALVGLVFVAELTLFAALSPELPALLERLGLRPRAAAPCDRRRSPLAETYQALHASDAWLSRENAIASAAPLDVWREGCWRFLVFPARVDGRDMEIVFAVSTAARHRTVRSALVEAEPSGTPDVAAARSA
ncbi:MauE/DoxX family redox-associated membrane protein [Actinomadura miaoliensis]|uniref:Methylamine utilisation protein MauE domain-containing protein n=1 Tax=Actinomadura miaoliensis TaxID=430685 RepID=A0ABP7V5Q3_9ACTN